MRVEIKIGGGHSFPLKAKELRGTELMLKEFFEHAGMPDDYYSVFVRRQEKGTPKRQGIVYVQGDGVKEDRLYIRLQWGGNDTCVSVSFTIPNGMNYDEVLDKFTKASETWEERNAQDNSRVDEKTEPLSDSDLVLIKDELDEVRSKWEERGIELQEVNSQEGVVKRRVSQAEKLGSTLRQEIEDLEKELVERKGELNVNSQSLKELKTKLAGLQRRRSSLEIELTELEDREHKLSTQEKRARIVESAESALKNLTKDLDDVGVDISQLLAGIRENSDK